MTALSARREELTRRLAELDSHLQSIEATLDETPDRDAQERATEREADQVLEGIGSAELQEARMIRAALERMEEGTYGACVKCGVEIPAARLDLLPYTPFCPECAR